VVLCGEVGLVSAREHRGLVLASVAKF
jgi:hypothetical protein